MRSQWITVSALSVCVGIGLNCGHVSTGTSGAVLPQLSDAVTDVPPTFSQTLSANAADIPPGGSLVSRSTFSNGEAVSVTGDVTLSDSQVVPLQFLKDGTDWVATFTSQLISPRGNAVLRVEGQNADGEKAPMNRTFKILGTRGDEPGLVAFYRFEESGAAALDSSIKGNNGTITGAIRQPGAYGQRMSFNGSTDYIFVPNSPSLQMTSTITMEAWIYVTKPDPTTTSYITGIVGKLNFSGATTYDMSVSMSGGLFCTLNDSSVQLGWQIQKNIWTHVACTYDGQTLRLFVNGRQQTMLTLSTPTGIQVTTDPVYLGVGGTGAAGYHYQGYMDEVAIWNSVRTEDQICADAGGIPAGNYLGQTACDYPFFPIN
ncbi:MAG TPA: LamG domain-containing protein [Bdellovibrionota bacterium]|nr:LamG domain-containing protein [Bdellovibrionota bacterium]